VCVRTVNLMERKNMKREERGCKNLVAVLFPIFVVKRRG